MPHPLGAASGRLLRTLLFVLSAALAAAALRLAWVFPFGGIAVLVTLLGTLGMRWASRRRAAALLRSGDVRLVLSRWTAAMQRVPHSETLGPLMTATALAAYGWIDRARDVMRMAHRGPAWEAALEHRLFVDALLLTFEGDTIAALDRARELEALPMPSSAPWLARRIRTLRRAVGALARAFAHLGEDGDRKLLLRAGQASPLVFWAMRYGAAISAVDARDLRLARRLIRDAPEWPAESCFHTFHTDIMAELERRSLPI